MRKKLFLAEALRSLKKALKEAFTAIALLGVLASTATADIRYMVDYVLPRGGGRGAGAEPKG